MNAKTKGFRKKESSIDKVKGKTHSFPLVKQDGEKAEKILKEKKEKIENPDDSDELTLALEKCIEDDKLIEFKDILTKYRNFYIEQTLEELLAFIHEQFYNKELFQNKIKFLEYLIEQAGVSKDSNMILDISVNKESILMKLCKFSFFGHISYLFNKKKELNVNYEDTLKRNALFYLQGGKEDKNIIGLLIKNNIDINHKDINGHTALDIAMINNKNMNLIYNLMDIKFPYFSDNLFEQLAKELKEYSSEIYIENEQLKKKIDNIICLLDDQVKKYLGDEYKIDTYGSRSTGLCLPKSDIDLVISGPITINNDNNEFKKYLEFLFKNLEQNAPFIKDIKFINKTKVPIIKIKTTEEYNNMNIDLSMDLHKGKECASFIKEQLEKYKPLREMTLALKTIFYSAKLNDPYEGGLSSYGIIILIIYFLVVKDMRKEEITYDKIGQLFFELLFFYKDDKYFKDIISIKNIDNLSKDFRNDPLRILDPLDNSNNIGKNAREINKIINLFDTSIKKILVYYNKGFFPQNILKEIFNAKYN